jgi:hypothetical protein
MYRPCRKCRRSADQDNRNGKQTCDSHQTHLLAPSCWRLRALADQTDGRARRLLLLALT